MNQKKKFWSGFFSGSAAALTAVTLVLIIFAVPIYIRMLSQPAGADPAATINGVDYYYKDGSYYDAEGNSFDLDELLGGDPDPGEVAEIKNERLERIHDKVDLLIDLIDEKFILDYTDQDVEDYIYKGLIAGLGDVYSSYMTAEEAQEASSDLTGNYCGIGALVQFDAETFNKTIMQVYRNSPAEEGGLKTGDIILAVDDTDVQGYPLDETVALVRGPEGEPVKLTILRGEEILEVSMVRRPVEAVDVSYEMQEGGRAYIKLTGFNDAGIGQMREALLDLKKQGMKSLVLDLRNNPGGSRYAVVGITDLFLPKDAIIAYEEDKAGNRDPYISENAPVCTEPMVVLVNENSASASELMCGALQDNGRATLVGTTTFGKGIIQTYYYLNDGSLAKLTSSYYYLPGGDCIHGKGVTPAVYLEDDPETEVDEQMQRAIDILK